MSISMNDKNQINQNQINWCPDNCHREKLPPWMIAPGILPSMKVVPQKIAPWMIVLFPGLLLSELLPPRRLSRRYLPLDNCLPDNCLSDDFLPV